MERQEVLDREDEAWNDLQTAIAAVPPDMHATAGVVPGWSTHDVVWHTAFWVGYGADALEAIHRGEAEPRDEDATEIENEDIAEAGRLMTWDEVIGGLEERRARARASLNGFEHPVPERAIVFFDDYTTEHYREHAEQIRTFGTASA